MQGKNISKSCAPVINFFTKTVQQANKAVKFVRRKSKLTAQLFCEALICGCLSDSKISLERMCEMLKERGIKITKQGLHQRFNDEAKLLMQTLFEKSLVQFKTEQSDVVELLKPFSSVKITDSSHCESSKLFKLFSISVLHFGNSLLHSFLDAFSSAQFSLSCLQRTMSAA